MFSNSITSYQVPPCASFDEFIKRIDCLYGKRTAFQNHTTEWSYHDLYLAVKKLTVYFSASDTPYFWISIEHPFYFCASLFAIVISGKVAMLSAFDQNTNDNIQQFTEESAIRQLQICNEESLPKNPNNNRLSVIAQSSGTTSIAKGVMLSQKNLLCDTIGGMTYYDYPLGAVYYHILPYSHLFGVVADLLGPLYSGGTICFSDNKLNFFKDMQVFKPTHMNLPPALVYMIEKMLLHSEDVVFSTGGRLKKIMCAGAHLNEQSRINMSRFGISVYAAYGLTECSPCVSLNSELFMKPGSVGKILPCCEVSVIDGEVAVRGDNVMLGYWHDPQATRNTIRNGWLFTGDIGYFDSDGFLFLTGRKTNIIVFENGRKVIPEAIEASISTISGIEECLVAKSDKQDRVLLTITAVTSESNNEWLRTQIMNHIEKFNLSDRVCSIVFQSQQLQKNKLGKIVRTPQIVAETGHM